MSERWVKRAALTLLLALLLTPPVYAWSNGGFSSNPSDPKYGTHDWIAEHALDWLLPEAKLWLVEHKAWFLYGTEIPDNPEGFFGIGDTQRHHVYYSLNGTLVDDSAARRANETFYKAFQNLVEGNHAVAAVYAGAMVHYISDVAVFSHVMGAGTGWGAEVHHEDFEKHVNSETSSYASSFNAYLIFDGDMVPPPSGIDYRNVFPPGAGKIYTWNGEMLRSPAYYATLWVAFDATFDLSRGNLTCKWMDVAYNWSNPLFVERVGCLLNKAVNMAADALYALYLKSKLYVNGLNEKDLVFASFLSPVKGDATTPVIYLNGTAFNSGIFIAAPRNTSLSYSFAEIVQTANPAKRYVLYGASDDYRAESCNSTGTVQLTDQTLLSAFCAEEFRCTFNVKGLGEDAVGKVLGIYWVNKREEYTAQDFPVTTWVSKEYIIDIARTVASSKLGKTYRLKGNYTEAIAELSEPKTITLEYEAAVEATPPSQPSPTWQLPSPEAAFSALAVIILLATLLLALRSLFKETFEGT